MADKIVIAGGSGFIGSRLAAHFLTQSCEVVVLSRNPRLHTPGSPIRSVHWDGQSLSGWEAELAGAKAVINLAGENIGRGRWSKKRREKILLSRVSAGRALCAALAEIEELPAVFIQASAVGFYGDRADEELDESSPAGKGFLADVVRQWESSTERVEQLGIRRVIVRMGIVLDRKNGVLPRFVLPFRFFVGGPLGSGRQWISWVHIADVVRAVDFLISCSDCQGVFNLVSPEPVINRDFARCLGMVLKRPAFFPTPAFALKMALGQQAQELLFASQRVLPKKLLALGFRFQFPDLTPALTDLLS